MRPSKLAFLAGGRSTSKTYVRLAYAQSPKLLWLPAKYSSSRATHKIRMTLNVLELWDRELHASVDWLFLLSWPVCGKSRTVFPQSFKIMWSSSVMTMTQIWTFCDLPFLSFKGAQDRQQGRIITSVARLGDMAPIGLLLTAVGALKFGFGGWRLNATF